MSCYDCVLNQDFDSCDVFLDRYGIDLSRVCKYFEKKSCECCVKFRHNACVLRLFDPKKCGEFFKNN